MLSKLIQTVIILGLLSISSVHAQRGSGMTKTYYNTCAGGVTYHKPCYTKRVKSTNCNKPICLTNTGKYRNYGRYTSKTPKPFYYPHFYQDQALKQTWASCRSQGDTRRYPKYDNFHQEAPKRASRGPVILNEVTRSYDSKNKRFILKESYKKSRVLKKPEASARGRNANLSGKILAKIDLSSQRMRVYKDGEHIYTWKVSTGKKGYATPRGVYKPQFLKKTHYSKRYNNAAMPYSVFFRENGYAIHGTNSVGKLGQRVSHGCVRLSPNNAKRFFRMVQKNGQRNTTIKIVS
jgi:lipoprotein-anchoring transpeptidase ErfK/SrfK